MIPLYHSSTNSLASTFNMRFTATFLTLLNGVSAVDIWLNWSSTKCSGSNSILCSGINPNTCCAISGRSGSPFASIDFREIPSGWDLNLRGHRGSQCGSVIESVASSGNTRVCLSRDPFGGGGYGFRNKRSDITEKCTETVQPDVLTFSDGIQFNIKDMDTSSLEEMVRCHSDFHAKRESLR